MDASFSNTWSQRWLRTVTLERFKAAFQPAAIPLNPFTILIGRNGSGKSTLLEALQWIDTTMRYDARTACDRYYGIHDLINLRSQTKSPYFSIALEWERLPEDPGTAEHSWWYSIFVLEDDDEYTALITREYLSLYRPRGRDTRYWIKTEDNGRRMLWPEDPLRTAIFEEPDRLGLSRGVRPGAATEGVPTPMAFLQDFWSRAVFLRLSPNRLFAGSPSRRRSFDPLLDEEGQTLPALLNELDGEQRKRLVVSIQDVLKDIRAVEILGASRQERARDERINYALRERMPYRGRSGRSEFPIPAWMLSEGTRRLTAIFALLEHDPPPSLLCIEEIENGLDPWAVLHVLRRLQSAADQGTQVLLTTHSPWLLDHVPIESILQVRREEGETRYERFEDREEIKRFAEGIPPGTRYVREE
jgi:predicted ATPase